MSKFQPTSGVETKYIDYTVSTTFPATTVTTWGISCINGVTLGQTLDTRIGNKIQMKSCQLRLMTPNYFNDITRVRVVYDKASNSTLPNITDILENDVNTSMVDKSTAGRFITLCDEYINNTDSAGGGYMEWNKYIKLDLPTIYTGTGAAYNAINAGSLYLMINTGGAVYTAQAIASYTRVRFTDT